MNAIHIVIAYSIPAGFLLLALWTLYSFLRNKPPHDWYWHVLGALQILLGIQIVVGIILFVLGGRPMPPSGPVWLHYVYGGLFPAALLVVAHRYASTRFREIPYVVFGIVALVNFGLTFRALQTGLG